MVFLEFKYFYKFWWDAELPMGRETQKVDS
jgi:hypothetical protein